MNGNTNAQKVLRSPASAITHEVDVRDVVAQKRRALAAHASQVAPDSFFLSMDDDAFALAFGQEWFIDPSMVRAPGAPRATTVFQEVP